MREAIGGKADGGWVARGECAAVSRWVLAKRQGCLFHIGSERLSAEWVLGKGERRSALEGEFSPSRSRGTVCEGRFRRPSGAGALWVKNPVADAHRLISGRPGWA